MIPSPAATSPARSPTPSLRHAFVGVWRLTLPGFLGAGRLLRLVGLLAGLALLTLATTRQSNPGQFFDWTIKFYLTFLVPVLAFITGGGAIRDDLKSETVDYVFTRPIPRPARARPETVPSATSVSPGNTGLSQRRVSMPGEPRLAASSR